MSGHSRLTSASSKICVYVFPYFITRFLKTQAIAMISSMLSDFAACQDRSANRAVSYIAGVISQASNHLESAGYSVARFPVLRQQRAHGIPAQGLCLR